MTGCKLVRPEPQALFDRIKNQFSATVLGGAPIIPESNEWYAVANEYASAEWFLSISEQMWKERDPRYCCCDNLVAMAAWDGVYPYPAKAARGYVTLSGAPGSTLNPAQQLQFGTLVFQVFNPSTVPSVMPAAGSVTLQFRCLTAGAGGNSLHANANCTLIDPPAGISATAVVAGSKFCGGLEAETCEAFRSRYIARQQFKPLAQFSHLKEAALAWPCATRAFLRGEMCCIPVAGCPVPIEMYVLFDGSFDHGCAPASICQELTDHLFGVPQGLGLGMAEIGVVGSVIPVIPAPINIVFAGLACATQAQQQEVLRRTAQIFASVAPATEICKNLFVGTIAQVVPDLCNFDVTVTTTDSRITITDCGDIEPDCDILPFLASAPVIT